METPTLSGQQQDYLVPQLRNYAIGKRRKDVFARMRVIAGLLTESEIAALAQYYSAQRPFR
jgi:cytochrome c553